MCGGDKIDCWVGEASLNSCEKGLNYDGCEEGLDADEGWDDGGALGARDERCETGLDERCETGLDVKQAKTASTIQCGFYVEEVLLRQLQLRTNTMVIQGVESLLCATLLPTERVLQDMTVWSTCSAETVLPTFPQLSSFTTNTHSWPTLCLCTEAFLPNLLTHEARSTTVVVPGRYFLRSP